MLCRPLVIAHRGASGHRPEHTAAAYRLGLALGADAVEPDLVPTRDGVLVVRHEHEISGTTDVADHPEFADRRVTKSFGPVELTGWFAEDFTWAELSTLRARERLPELRPGSAAFDRQEPILRFSDLLDLLDGVPAASGGRATLVAELKHTDYFASIGIDLPAMYAAEVAARVPAAALVTECFEFDGLLAARAAGVSGRFVFLSEELPRLAPVVEAGIDGVSVDKARLLAPGGAAFVASARGAGLAVYAWTLRPENAFLEPAYRLGADPAAWGDWETEYRAVLATGVDAVFADHPDLAPRLFQDGGIGNT